MNTEHNDRCDFNRFLYKGIPITKHLQQGNPVISANRDAFIIRLANRFSEEIKKGESSHNSLYTNFTEISRYLRWCDKNNIESFTKSSLEGNFEHLLEKVYLKQLKRSSYSTRLSCMTVVFRDYLDFPSSWFLSISITGKDDKEPFEAYSRNDLNQLLPFLRKLFDQTSEQFLNNPKKHMDAWKCTQTMTFNWKGQDYPLCAAISKMMCAATYLLSYYTFSNTSIIFGLKRPLNASISLGEEWYTMPAFKRRAFKTIHIEMGGHNYLEIPKYCMVFFNKLIEVSKIIDDSDGAFLLQTYVNKSVQPIKSNTLQAFCRLWINKNFQFTDQTGRQLRPVISRFRETGAQLTAYHQGEIANNILLDNTPQTRKRHYTSGNRQKNNSMMQDTALILQEQVVEKTSVKAAQEALGIDVLTIEEEYKINIPELSKTPNGASCSNPFGEKSEAFNRRAKKHHLLKEGERLACADLLSCFGCPEQVIVQSVSDIWCLLSFKACIEESLYLHLDVHHYRQNFENIISFIDVRILPKIKKSILKQAELKLADDGAHPLWNDAGSIISMLPSKSKLDIERNL